MRALTVALTVSLSLLFPALTLLWLYRTRARSGLLLLAVLALAVVSSAATVLSYGYWFAVGMYWPLLLLLALLATAVARFRRPLPSTWLPRLWSREFFLSGTAIVLTAAAGAALPFVARSKSYQGTALELAYPLGGGTFVVIAGGANWSVNQHAYLAPLQRFAVDVARLNRFGMRASGLSPTDLSRYRAFGSPVLAPCSGEVVMVEANHDDRPPLSPDPVSALGNQVVIFCNEHSVVLGHLRAGSVSVEAGDRVEVGERVAQVGNSGSTLEPHLHIHAVRGRHSPTGDLILSQPSVPIRLGGRFLVKNEWFTSPEPGAS